MSEISYGNLILAESGKKGVLPPDANGNYRLNSGAFNHENHAGINYPANQYVIDQMKENSDLQRRILQGYCYMEEEHPEPYNYIYRNGICYKEEMTSILEWINRLRNYDHDRIVGVISKIIFTPEDDRDLTKPIWTEILCKPLLEYKLGPRFKENLDTPEANTAVSIRTQIEPFKPQTRQKNIVYWTGFDWVKEPGYIHANKHMSAGCESFLSGQHYDDQVKTFKTRDVIEALELGISQAANDEVALKRYGGMEALDMFKGELDRLVKNYKRGESVQIMSATSFSDIFR